jgi:hypothetical protein
MNESDFLLLALPCVKTLDPIANESTLSFSIREKGSDSMCLEVEVRCPGHTGYEICSSLIKVH